MESMVTILLYFGKHRKEKPKYVIIQIVDILDIDETENEEKTQL